MLTRSDVPDPRESEAVAETRTRPEPVAPWFHTVFLLCVLVLWALYGVLHPRVLSAMMPRSVSYVSHVVLECLLAGTTIAGLYHRRRFLTGVLGNVTLRGLFLDIVQGFLIYLGGTVTVLAIWLVLKPLHPTYQTEAIRAMGPHTWAEVALFAILSLAAGTCEEFVFRGYLLRQFQRWWGSTVAAVIVSSVLFGCLHLYEGWGAVVGICGLGAVYAIVAVRRGNLRSAMAAHFLQDAITGLILFLHHS
ncbi:MAG: CPBP family intramembrane metalloprotease [Acidobacteriota bacterium]|nr:CPBP family intramembrane metalloprotease [Acidobacteriota bacterium]